MTYDERANLTPVCMPQEKLLMPISFARLPIRAGEQSIGRERQRGAMAATALGASWQRPACLTVGQRLCGYSGAVVRNAARFARAVVRRLGITFRGQPGEIRPRRNPSRPQTLGSFAFKAIVGTWYESDVIEATIRNAFTQGCDEVFLVDNNSPDDTAARAVDAGAVVARTFATDGYDEPLRIRLMNEVVWEVSKKSGLDHVWWLWLDADEFPHGPGGLTLRAYLQSLDRAFRLVGTRYFNHFPSAAPEYAAGRHPIDFQPLAQEFRAASFGTCPSGHWKHPLQRFDRTGPQIESAPGFHKVSCSAALFEPMVPILTHHFPYRERTFCYRRMEALCGSRPEQEPRNDPHDKRVGGLSGIRKRYQSLDHVYARQWEQVENLGRDGDRMGVNPVPWDTLVSPADRSIRLWYDSTSNNHSVGDAPRRS